MIPILFYRADIQSDYLKERKAVKRFISEIFQLENKNIGQIRFIFCSDSYLLDINRSFLNHDYFTDVVTFNLSEGEEIIGEVYISVDTVKSNSTIHGTAYPTELLRVIIHGALHLIGYNDKKKKEITIMRAKEEYYLRIFASK